MKDAYTPRPGTLPARVIEYFLVNADEELFRSDIAAKFGVAPGAIDASLAAAIDAGAIKTARGEDSQRVWVAGPRIGECVITADAAAAAPGNAAGGG